MMASRSRSSNVATSSTPATPMPIAITRTRITILRSDCFFVGGVTCSGSSRSPALSTSEITRLVGGAVLAHPAHPAPPSPGERRGRAATTLTALVSTIAHTRVGYLLLRPVDQHAGDHARPPAVDRALREQRGALHLVVEHVQRTTRRYRPGVTGARNRRPCRSAPAPGRRCRMRRSRRRAPSTPPRGRRRRVRSRSRNGRRRDTRAARSASWRRPCGPSRS